ncbi:MAG: thiamine pyrophosphate-binding protein [Bacteroidales bacterium]|nr:thiamine pyrophosphate-binding protein [Bacteroidales bacterium]MCM1146227.1 thiamine pyrophosphate-binding protein [Bacteroidales bacterium]MCM1205335.1 thiamine pyrophosphate-binding protein [Bacillota bacterium]MCM1509578.1 thiamine pyrophosphate-binding protein [Clostridium sp.]
MSEIHYSSEKSVQIIQKLLKEHGIRKIIASPGATDMAIVVSFQHDPWFEMYSEVDERGAAYLACGMAAESGEPVVITCTGATSSRNYMPGLTEAFYRKLPVLAITCSRDNNLIGHNVDQSTDRTVLPNDVAQVSVQVQVVDTPDDEWDVMIKVNKAILALMRNGGGPCHINLATQRSPVFNVKELPKVRVINRYTLEDKLPDIPKGTVGIFVGAHNQWSDELTALVDRFCGIYDACVFCDHTSNYKGKYRILFPLMNDQYGADKGAETIDTLIHIGHVSNCIFTGKRIWRVNEDGEIRDPFKKMNNVFQMSELTFFKAYTLGQEDSHKNTLWTSYVEKYKKLLIGIPELPFSNMWIAQQMANKLPEKSVLHLGIRNSLRSWNYFEVPQSVLGYCNTGGFGIDGGISSMLGASFVSVDKIFFGVFGDLLFFYDMNSIGNRHIKSNVRILMINNGLGQEFKNYCFGGSVLGNCINEFTAAEGHFGKKSYTLVKAYAEALGFEYLTAKSKDEFNQNVDYFLSPIMTERPILFEVFTNTEDESRAFELITMQTRYAYLKKTVTDLKNSPEMNGIRIFAKKLLNK